MTKNSFVAEVTFNDKKEVIPFIWRYIPANIYLFKITIKTLEKVVKYVKS